MFFSKVYNTIDWIYSSHLLWFVKIYSEQQQQRNVLFISHIANILDFFSHILSPHCDLQNEYCIECVFEVNWHQTTCTILAVLWSPCQGFHNIPLKARTNAHAIKRDCSLQLELVEITNDNDCTINI